MADKVKPADDPNIKAAVGYGFDASLRKGTQAGVAAMRGSNEYQKLDSKSKDFAEELFKRRIESDSNLKQFKGIGDEKVAVYRKAAQEKPARVIDYKKEFGAKPKQTSKSSTVPKLKMEEIAPPKKSAKPASKVDKTPLPNPDMGFRPFAKADKPKPAQPRANSTGMSQMLNLSALAPKPAAKVTPTPTKSSPKTTTAAPIRKAMGMPAAPKSDKVNVPGMGMMDKDAAMRMRAFKR